MLTKIRRCSLCRFLSINIAIVLYPINKLYNLCVFFQKTFNNATGGQRDQRVKVPFRQKKRT